MTDNEIIKELQAVSEWFKEHGRNTNTAIIGICEMAMDYINRQEAELEKLKADQKVEQQLLKDREEMPLPYDEEEFLRKAILQVIGWIEEIPNYKILGTVVLTKTRVDEMKDRIKEISNDR